MATYNNVQEYKPEAESIAAYLERVEIFFQANDIAAYKAGACVFQRRMRKDVLLASGPDSACFYRGGAIVFLIDTRGGGACFPGVEL